MSHGSDRKDKTEQVPVREDLDQESWDEIDDGWGDTSSVSGVKEQHTEELEEVTRAASSSEQRAIWEAGQRDPTPVLPEAQRDWDESEEEATPSSISHSERWAGDIEEKNHIKDEAKSDEDVSEAPSGTSNKATAEVPISTSTADKPVVASVPAETASSSFPWATVIPIAVVTGLLLLAIIFWSK